MEELLLEKLHSFIAENNPDLLVQLSDRREITAYLENKVHLVLPLITELKRAGKPAHVIEEKCMDRLTADLRPSRFHYIRRVLEDEYETTYCRYAENGTLTYEIIGMLDDCNLVFEDYGFCEDNEHNRRLRKMIVETINEYLDRKS